MKRGKRYLELAKKFDRANLYDVAEAISIVKQNASAKFDETIEAHIRTGSRIVAMSFCEPRSCHLNLSS